MFRYFLVTLLLVSYTNNSYAYIDDNRQIMAGIKINSNGPQLYLNYQEKSYYEKLNNYHSGKTNLPKINLSFNSDLYKNLKTNSLSYRGYQNVQGYKNNKRKNDKRFAITVISIGLFTVAAGALTIGAIVDAIDD